MRRITKDQFSGSRSKVEQSDLEEEAAILTVAAVDEITVDDPERASGKRTSLVLVFEELGDKVLWLNQTQVGYLIDRLGDDTDTWVGEKVPVEKHDSNMRGKSHKKVWVCAPETWDDLLEEAGFARKKKAAVVKKPAKRGR